MENKWKNKNFFASLINALNGIVYIIKKERNIKDNPLIPRCVEAVDICCLASTELQSQLYLP